MFRWIVDNIFQHMSAPAERQIGHCVTSQLVEEINRLQRREADLVHLLRRVREYEHYVTHGAGPLLTEMTRLIGDEK